MTDPRFEGFLIVITSALLVVLFVYGVAHILYGI